MTVGLLQNFLAIFDIFLLVPDSNYNVVPISIILIILSTIEILIIPDLDEEGGADSDQRSKSYSFIAHLTTIVTSLVGMTMQIFSLTALLYKHVFFYFCLSSTLIVTTYVVLL